MSDHRITRFVFWLDGALVSKDSDCRILPGMADVLEILQPNFELWLVSSYPAPQTAAVVSDNSLSYWFSDRVVDLPPDDMVDDRALLNALVTAGVIYPGTSLWVDDHPKRTMLAIRQGIDATIFVDARRFRRDLVLWGIVG